MFKPTFLYIKTHNITGLKYFGKTSTKDPYSYTGSGVYWVRHLKRYGANFTTEILGYFLDEEECKLVALRFSRENDIVNSLEWANLKEEALDGGWDYVNSSGKNLYGANGQSGHGLENLIRNPHDYMKSIGLYDDYIHRIATTLKRKYSSGELVNPFKGKSHTEETKFKMVNTHKEICHQQGEKNSQFGTMWITNGVINKKIKNTDILPDGWKRGRVVSGK